MPKLKLQRRLEPIIGNPMLGESPDCSIVELSDHKFLVSTVDFFYPLVTDPYLQGQIACCNVLSDLYALGIEKCDSMLMTLTVSWDMSENEQEIVTRTIISGFNNIAEKAETKITGGQTIVNPAPIVGGVAISVATEDQFIRPCSAAVGDTVVLTKPLGTQIAVNLFEWFYSKKEIFEELTRKPDESKVVEIFNKACGFMASLNRNAAKLMKKYGAKACTDVTGFGIKGHAENLASIQHNKVDIKIHTVPLIQGVKDIEKQVRDFKLLEGLSPETSGGLLIVFPQNQVQAFLEEFQTLEGRPAWIVGEITPGNNQVLLENPNIIEV